jgi:voltage-gated potassium channel
LLGTGSAGVLGFYVIWLSFSPDPSSRGILDALYLAVITLTTVGYTDNMELLSLPEPGRTISQVFSVAYILVSYGIVIWTSSLIIAYVVEGSLSDILFRRRQSRRVRMFNDHFILCGVGRTGPEIAAEFSKTGIPLVVVDIDQSTLEPLASASSSIAVIAGDASSEEVLRDAGIGQARGLIANLANDAENLFLTITAKALNHNLRVVSAAVDRKSHEKLVRAGADSVVFPWQIGALRIASEMIRPTVVSFLDRMLRDPAQSVRVSEVSVAAGSSLAGTTINSSGIQDRTGLLVVALHAAGSPSDAFVYNPPGNHVIRDGDTLVVIGTSVQIDQLSEMAS